MAVSTLIIDDGELQDIRDTLQELGVEYRWLRSGPARDAKHESPARLFVATARYALQADPMAGQASLRPVCMAVLDDDARTVCTQLRERGFDYVLRRPVHPIALRLLLLRSLYRGDERRVSARAAIGIPTSYRATFRRRPALLADLSRSGCRFYGPKRLHADSEIRIQLPKEMTGGESVDLPGWVVRCEPDPLGGAGLPYGVGLAFEPLPDAVDEELRVLLEARASGPQRLTADEARRAWQEWSSQAAARRRSGSATVAQSGKRRTPRRLFRSRVAAVTQRDRALRTLVGRNLSTGGMLVEPESNLRVGDRLTVGLFGKPGQRLDVRAQVVRSDPEQGLALSFEAMPAEATRELEALVARLEASEDRRASDGASLVQVVGEITRRERR